MMGMNVETTSDSNLLLVVTTGEFSLAEAERTFQQILDAIVEHQSEKVLFDGRTVAGDPTFIERFYYGEFAAESVINIIKFLKHGKNPRFAYVLDPEVIDSNRLGETVARNRGMNVRVFETTEEASKWLHEPIGEVWPAKIITTSIKRP